MSNKKEQEKKIPLTLTEKLAQNQYLIKKVKGNMLKVDRRIFKDGSLNNWKMALYTIVVFLFFSGVVTYFLLPFWAADYQMNFSLYKNADYMELTMNYFNDYEKVYMVFKDYVFLMLESQKQIDINYLYVGFYSIVGIVTIVFRRYFINIFLKRKQELQNFLTNSDLSDTLYIQKDDTSNQKLVLKLIPVAGGVEKVHTTLKDQSGFIKSFLKVGVINFEQLKDEFVIYYSNPLLTMEKVKQMKLKNDFVKKGYVNMGLFSPTSKQIKEMKIPKRHLLKDPIDKEVSGSYSPYFVDYKSVFTKTTLMFGASGSGKTVNYFNILRQLFNQKLDKLFFFDYKNDLTKILQKYKDRIIKENPELKDKIEETLYIADDSPSTIMKLFFKLEFIFKFRMAYKAKYGDKKFNETFNSITVVIDEMNVLFKKADSGDKVVKKFVDIIQTQISVVAMLYRSVKINVIAAGQSSQVQHGVPSALVNNSMNIFSLRQQEQAATISISPKYADMGGDLSELKTAQTVHFDMEKSTYIEFLPTFISEDSFINETPLLNLNTENKDTNIDKTMVSYIQKEKHYLIEERRMYLKENQTKLDYSDEQVEEEVNEFISNYDLILEELSNNIFVPKATYKQTDLLDQAEEEVKSGKSENIKSDNDLLSKVPQPKEVIKPEPIKVKEPELVNVPEPERSPKLQKIKEQPKQESKIEVDPDFEKKDNPPAKIEHKKEISIKTQSDLDNLNEMNKEAMVNKTKSELDFDFGFEELDSKIEKLNSEKLEEPKTIEYEIMAHVEKMEKSGFSEEKISEYIMSKAHLLNEEKEELESAMTPEEIEEVQDLDELLNF